MTPLNHRPSQTELRRGEVIGFGARRAVITAADWHGMVRGTLQGFLTLRLPSGMELRECSYHRQGDKRWIGLPGKPQIDQEGRHRVDPSPCRCAALRRPLGELDGVGRDALAPGGRGLVLAQRRQR